jgi:hypothetical protein
MKMRDQVSSVAEHHRQHMVHLRLALVRPRVLRFSYSSFESQKRRDVAVFPLNATTDALNLAKGGTDMTLGKAAFGSTSVPAATHPKPT